MKLVYIEGSSPPEDLAKACQKIGMFKYANMDRFNGVVKLVSEVYTENDKIGDEYRAAGVTVKPLPSNTKKPDNTPVKKGKATSKKGEQPDSVATPNKITN